jgi:hypothetical protein
VRHPVLPRLEIANNFAQSSESTYDAVVLGLLGRRGLEAGISVFALLGFCYVPLGEHTGLEHAKAIFSTPAAKRAGGELIEAFSRVRSKLTGEAVQFASSEATESPSAQPSARHADGSRPERSHHSVEPKPRLPHLGSDSNAHLAPQEPLQPASDANAPDASVEWHES